MMTGRTALIVEPSKGRKYNMGRMNAIFFADGDETDKKYSISEWFLDAKTNGPGAHSHPDDHIFYVLTGTLSLIIENQRTDAGPGTYAIIPGGVSHDFENHANDQCGFISINIPAGFEEMMPRLFTHFSEHPLSTIDA